MMLHHPTHDKLNKLRLFGMARALHDQGSLDLDHLGFEERLGLLADPEATERDRRRFACLLRAKLKPNTVAEDTDYRHARGLDKPLFQRLLAGQWLCKAERAADRPDGRGQDLARLRAGPPSVPISATAYFVRFPRLLDELSIGQADGRYTKLLKQLARIDALVIDDWGLAVSTMCTAAIYWRCSTTATAPVRPSSPANCRSITGTPPSAMPHWPTPRSYSSRLVHNAHQLTLKGDSMRKMPPLPLTAQTDRSETPNFDPTSLRP
ncbi:ATP-binding protein [Cupriavidus necator]